jgi:photosynthetic reaction center H subunit
MGTGAITGYVDVAQLVLYAFWVFFFILIYWLQRESKREGYPMHTDRPGRDYVDGLLPLPKPKVYKLANGEEMLAPHTRDHAKVELAAIPVAPFPGAPLDPTGANPMLDNIGPGSWTNRADHPEHTHTGDILIKRLADLPGFSLATQDRDPRGMSVLGADGQSGGVVRDVWIDQAEMVVRYLELETATGARKLLPLNFARIGRESVQVEAIMGGQFAHVPGTKLPTQVTSLEEEKIMAYFGAGTLYADPKRAEVWL